MKLKHISEENCSDCGARVAAERYYWTHVSGEDKESREYACGKTLTYSPNFSEIEVTSFCTRAKDYVESISLFEENKALLTNIAATMFTQEQFEVIEKGISCVNWCPGRGR